MKFISRRLHPFLNVIFGRFNWQKPDWLIKTVNQMYKHPYRFGGMMISLLIIMISGVYGLTKHPFWLKHGLIVAEISVPEIPDATDQLQPPLPLQVKFVQNQLEQSVAPLSKINKVLTTGVSLSPYFPGVWRWQSDSQLSFTPAQPWLAGQAYTLKLNPKLFATSVKLQKYIYSWSTPGFAAHIHGLTLYQNPKNPAEQQVVATIEFNYPIDPHAIIQHIALIPQQGSPWPVSITTGKLNREVYVHSANVQLGVQPQTVVLKIDGDAQPALSHARLNKPVVDKILLPDLGSMLKISGLDSRVMRNPNGIPEQILSFNSSIGVATPDLTQSIHAYILPKKTGGLAWRSPGEVTADQLSLAEVLPLQAVTADHDYPTQHIFRYSAPPGRTIAVIVDGGLPGYGGYHLQDSFRGLIQAPEYPQEIRFLHTGSLWSFSSEHKLSVLVQGVSAVKFEISRILPNQINHLISQTGGSFDDPDFSSDHFNKDDLSELFSEIQRFNLEDQTKLHYTTVDLDQYLPPNKNNPRPLGLFLLTAKGWDVNHHTETSVQTSRLILMTDMGLIIKNNADHTHDVFVQSISNGQPVAGVQVTILGRNGLAVASSVTDAQGHALLPNVEQFEHEQEPTVYLARKNNDVVFMPFAERDRNLNLSRFEVGGVTDDNRIHNLSADLFSDRGIYRPGELIHFGMVVKQAYAHSAGVGIPVEAVLTDPRGVVVLDKKMLVNDVGLLTLDYQTQENSLTGHYSLTLDLIKDGKRSDDLGVTHVQLAEFLPDTMKISSQLTAENDHGWVFPEKLGAKITLQNLFGAPAMNRKVTGKIVLAPHPFYFQQFPDYIFYNPLDNPNKPLQMVTQDLSVQQTDVKGHAQFDFDLGRFDKGSYRLTFYTQGFEADSGRSVTTANSVLVSPLRYLIGYKTDGAMDFIQQDSKRSINLLAVDHQLQKIAVPGLTLQLFKQHQAATLVQKDNGLYQYETIMQEIPVTQIKLNLPADGYQYALPTHLVGDYALVITGADGVLNRMTFSVVGRSQSTLQKNTELTVKLDRSEYKVGDNIQLQITAPYTGSGLMTIERDKIYAYKWFTAHTPNTLQTIALPKGLVGNGYINVTFVRDWNSPEIFLSPLSYRVVPFRVNPGNHAMQINLKVPEEIKPGQDLPIQYSASRAGKMLVFAVDEGVLRAADYVTPDPLGFFFAKRALQVSTTQIVDQILPKFITARELSAVGGDDRATADQHYLNPFKRITEKPVVFWSGIVDVDQQPRTLHYPVPDYFNGSLRIMAVAVDHQAVGAAMRSTLVRGDFILTPNIPRVAAPGDQFEVSVNVTNNIQNSQPLPIHVALTASPGIKIMSNATQTLTISAHQEQVAHFQVAALSQLGNATFTFAVASSTHGGRIQATTSIRPATPYQTTLISGADHSQAKTIPLPRKLYPDFALQTAVSADSPLIFLQGLQIYLDSYPYGCTEQVSSKGFGYLTYARLTHNLDKSTVQLKLADTIQTLRQRQTSEGGFLYWPGVAANSPDSRFASIYALHFLTEAYDQGYEIPEALRRSGVTYLNDVAAQPVYSLEDARLQAYAIYVLARNEIVPTNYLANLQQYLEEHDPLVWKKDITAAFIAASYQLLQDNQTANQLINGYQLHNTDDANHFFDASTSDALYVYLLERHFPEKFQALKDTVLLNIADEVAKDRIDTVSAAYTLLALGADAAATMPGAHSLAIKQIFADKTIQPLLRPERLTPVNISPDAVKLEFANPNRLGYFYQIYTAGYDHDLPLQPLSHGLEIEREYSVGDLPVAGTVERGDDITVHLKLRSQDHQRYTHIAIVDLLPGGFELAPHSFQGSYDYADAREDRIIFYTTAGAQVTEITYHIKPVITGEFIVPPSFAENMYNQRIMFRGVASRIIVK